MIIKYDKDQIDDDGDDGDQDCDVDDLKMLMMLLWFIEDVLKDYIMIL